MKDIQKASLVVLCAWAMGTGLKMARLYFLGEALTLIPDAFTLWFDWIMLSGLGLVNGVWLIFAGREDNGIQDKDEEAG